MEKMTVQEAYEKAVNGVIDQGGFSYDVGLCLYRDDCGKKCAIGHIIPDSLYCAELEGNTVSEICVRTVLKRLIEGLDARAAALFRKIQTIHDEMAQEVHILDVRKKLEIFRGRCIDAGKAHHLDTFRISEVSITEG